MAKKLSKSGIITGNTVRAWHVTQSIDAFNGSEAYDISLSGSLNMTGSINGQPLIINPLTASYAITSSYSFYAVSASHEIIKEVSSSYADTASYAQSGNGTFNGTFSGSFSGSTSTTLSEVVDNGNVLNAGQTVLIQTGAFIKGSGSLGQIEFGTYADNDISITSDAGVFASGALYISDSEVSTYWEGSPLIRVSGQSTNVKGTGAGNSPAGRFLLGPRTGLAFDSDSLTVDQAEDIIFSGSLMDIPRNIRPRTHNTYDLGSSSLWWANIYANTFTGSFVGDGSGLTNLPATSGIWGISNSSGSYTYYDTISASNAAAVAGDTIELFTNVNETGTTEWILKNGVNYNLNGHTYEMSNSGTNNAVTDNNVAVTCTIFNGTIKRSGGTSSSTDTFALHIDSLTSVITLEGVVVESTCGYTTKVDGHLIGGHHVSNTHASIFSGNKITNCTAYNTSAQVCISNSGGNAKNCHAYSTSGIAFQNSFGGKATDCSGYSDGSYGFVGATGGGTSTNVNCTGYSTANHGFYIYNNAGQNSGIKGYSTAGIGINNVSGGPFSNSTGISTANVGFNVGIGQQTYNCYGESSAAAAAQVLGEIFNCTFRCNWNNASGHAILGWASYPPDYVFECTLIVTNASANCIYHGIAANVYYGNNTFRGATTPIHANITNSQTNTPDLYGNITIG